MRVLLLNPPAPAGIAMVREGRCMQRRGAWGTVWPPISLAYIGSLLEKNGFEVILKDCIVENIDFEELKEIIENYKPKLIISNTSTPSITSDLSVAKLAKKINKNISIAFFGIHVSALAEQCLNKNIDFIIRGEPEFTALEIAKFIKHGGNEKKILGVSYLNGKIIHNKDRPYTNNLDSLPFPAWHLINKKNYLLPFENKPFLLLATSRGCPYNCKFCASKEYYGKKLRLRTQKKIVAEMSYIKKKFGIYNFLFWSESFTIDNRFVHTLCNEMIKSKENFRWICNSRVDTINLELLKKMKKAGCWMISFGIESANQDILDLMNKGITLNEIKNAVNWSRKAGLETVGHFVLGYPGETIQHIKNTINLSKKLGLDYAQFYCSVPFPGSKLYEDALHNKWISKRNWRFYEQNFSVLNTNLITSAEIEKLRRKAYIDFYSRPKILFMNMMKIRNFKSFIGLTKEFMNWI